MYEFSNEELWDQVSARNLMLGDEIRIDGEKVRILEKTEDGHQKVRIRYIGSHGEKNISLPADDRIDTINQRHMEASLSSI